MTRPPFDRRALAVILLIWIAGAGALELYRSGWLWQADPWTRDQPSTWRITSRHAAALADLLTPLDPSTVPRGRLTVLPLEDRAGEGVFFYLWARYFTPHLDVQLRQDVGKLNPSEAPAADYLLVGPSAREVSFARETFPEFHEVRRTEAGSLYQRAFPR